MVAVVMPQPWWPLSPWLSPAAAWFVFFNAVVAAIAVMSSSGARQDHASRMRLRRSASSAVLDHLRSFSLFSVHPVAGGGGVAVPALDDLVVGVTDSDYCYCHNSQEAEDQPAPQVTDPVPTVVSDSETPRQTASAVGVVESGSMAERSMATSAPVAAEPASATESKEEQAEAEGEEEQGKSISMDEAYAMVQQRRALQSLAAPAAAAISVAAAATTTATAASWPQKTEDPKRRRRRGRRGAEEPPEGKAELNARAELFIRQFREELKLQRINSLLRHTHAFGPVDGTPVAVS